MEFHNPVTVTFDPTCSDTLSPLLFGDNLEHTRDCIHTGLSAQMLKNRKFASMPQRSGCAMEWEPVGESPVFSLKEPYTRHGEGYRMVRSHERYSQRITSYIPEDAGIRQRGLYVQKGCNYLLCVTAKCFRPMELTASLRSSDGKLLASVSLHVTDSEFAPLDAVLCPSETDFNAALEITFCQPGTLYIGAVSLMPEDNFRGMRTDVVALLKQMGIRLLRWPGGNFSGEYHWKDGFLPRDQRAPFQSYLWLETQPHSLGYDFHEINTDDFVALCREIGAEPFITINPTWNTPEESAQWVEYCNGSTETPYGKLRAQRGHPEPYCVKFWSLGNEFGYGHMEGTNGPVEYAAAVKIHAQKMLAVTPDLKLCSSGPYPNAQWAQLSAKELKDVAPTVSLHHYPHFPDYIDPETRKAEYYEFITNPERDYLELVKQLRSQLDPDIGISLDEWNTWHAWYRQGSISEGIYAARLLNLMYMNAKEYGITQICHFESTNEGSILVLPDRAIMTPAGMAISSMKDHAGAFIRALEDDVVATEKGGCITCTLINRSYDQPKTFLLEKCGTAAAEILSGKGVVNRSYFEKTVLALEEEGEYIRAVLPAHSIAVVKIQK